MLVKGAPDIELTKENPTPCLYKCTMRHPLQYFLVILGRLIKVSHCVFILHPRGGAWFIIMTLYISRLSADYKVKFVSKCLWWFWIDSFSLIRRHPLQGRHNKRDGVSNHRRLDGLLDRLFTKAQIKGNIKPPRHWLLWGESTGDRWIPLTRGR